VAICFGLLVAQVWFDLRIPDYMSKVTTILGSGQGNTGQIWSICYEMLLFAGGSLLVAIFVGLLSAFVGAGFSKRMRTKVYDKVDSFGLFEMEKFGTASLVMRSTNDITQVRMFITMGLQMLIKAPMMAVWAIVTISGKRFEWSLATIVAVGILCVMFAIILVLVIPKFSKMQQMTDDLNRITRENLLGLSVVRAYNSEKYQQAKFETANKRLVRAQIFTGQASSTMLPIMSFVLNALTLSIFWMGAYIINATPSLQDKGEIFGNTIVFSSYSVLIVQAFMQITMIFIFLPRASVSAKRIKEVLAVKPRVVEGECTQGVEGAVGTLCFEKVCFGYSQKEVLHDISFEIAGGQTLALIGSTGSGKTTVVNLLNRFYDVTSGKIWLDGVDIKEYCFESLYQKIGLVTQKAVMFDGTVASNVAFGVERPLPNEECGQEETSHKAEQYAQDICEALHIAGAKDFVDNMPDKEFAEIARGGQNVSGGQKQRLSIARAVFKKPEFLVFDDSFSALDYKTDRAVRSALNQKTKGTTKIIVAQRIGTIKDADKIIVLDAGQVVGVGTHKALLKECAVYYEIAKSQLSEEELLA